MQHIWTGLIETPLFYINILSILTSQTRSVLMKYDQACKNILLGRILFAAKGGGCFVNPYKKKLRATAALNRLVTLPNIVFVQVSIQTNISLKNFVF